MSNKGRAHCSLFQARCAQHHTFSSNMFQTQYAAQGYGGGVQLPAKRTTGSKASGVMVRVGAVSR